MSTHTNLLETLRGIVGGRVHLQRQAVGGRGQQVHKLHAEHDVAAHVIERGRERLEAVRGRERGDRPDRGPRRDRRETANA